MTRIKPYIDAFHGHVYQYCKDNWIAFHVGAAAAIGLSVVALFYRDKNQSVRTVTDITFIALTLLVIFYYFYNRTIWAEAPSEFGLRVLLPFSIMTGLAYSIRFSRNVSRLKKGIAATVFVVIMWYFIESFVFVDLLPVNVLINWG